MTPPTLIVVQGPYDPVAAALRASSLVTVRDVAESTKWMSFFVDGSAPAAVSWNDTEAQTLIVVADPEDRGLPRRVYAALTDGLQYDITLHAAGNDDHVVAHRPAHEAVAEE